MIGSCLRIMSGLYFVTCTNPLVRFEGFLIRRFSPLWEDVMFRLGTSALMSPSWLLLGWSGW